MFAVVHTHFGQDPYSGSLFLFRSKRGNFIKILWWDI
ncbi:MAG: IS66 family insertion sequence element accessory protein TnpB, partial [Ktedonobacteraceae bacterium]